MTKEELQKEVGINLQKARIEKQMTREELAEKSEISPQFLANLEYGSRMMSLQTLRKLADALCVSADTLVYGNNSNARIREIGRLLEDQPEEVIRYIEELIYFTTTHISRFTGSDTSRKGVAETDELTV